MNTTGYILKFDFNFHHFNELKLLKFSKPINKLQIGQ